MNKKYLPNVPVLKVKIIPSAFPELFIMDKYRGNVY